MPLAIKAFNVNITGTTTIVYTCPVSRVAKVSIGVVDFPSASATRRITIGGIDIFSTTGGTSTSLLFNKYSLTAGSLSCVSSPPIECYMTAGETITVTGSAGVPVSANFLVIEEAAS